MATAIASAEMLQAFDELPDAVRYGLAFAIPCLVTLLATPFAARAAITPYPTVSAGSNSRSFASISKASSTRPRRSSRCRSGRR